MRNNSIYRISFYPPYGLAHQDTTENQKGGYKQSYFNGNIHSYGSWNLIVQR